MLRLGLIWEFLWNMANNCNYLAQVMHNWMKTTNFPANTGIMCWNVIWRQHLDVFTKQTWPKTQTTDTAYANRRTAHTPTPHTHSLLFAAAGREQVAGGSTARQTDSIDVRIRGATGLGSGFTSALKKGLRDRLPAWDQGLAVLFINPGYRWATAAEKCRAAAGLRGNLKVGRATTS